MRRQKESRVSGAVSEEKAEGADVDREGVEPGCGGDAGF